MPGPARKAASARAAIRDRITGFGRMPASELRRNPKNWRTHDNEQREAIRSVLSDIGFAGAILTYPDPDDPALPPIILDGHLRQEELGDAEVPVLFTDLTPEEAAKVLATFDVIASMAGVDEGALESLLQEVEIGSESLAATLRGLMGASEDGVDADAAGLSDVEVRELPTMAWVLIGVPTPLLGEVQPLIDAVALMPEAQLHVTANNAKP
jgi:hypothetical protein